MANKKVYGATKYGGTYSGVGVDVRGVEDVLAALEGLNDKQAKAMLQKSVTAGSKALKPYVKSRAPVRTGALKKSVRTGQTKRKRPAARVWLQKDIGGKRGTNTTFYRHMVVGGTKAHRIRFHNQVEAGVAKNGGNIRHPGAKANPFVAQGFDAGRSAAEKAIDAVVDKYLASL
jgi:HK97 gp10 family phage protein